MSAKSLYVMLLHMQHTKTGENRLLTKHAVAEGEEDALLKASLLAHPGEGATDNWVVLSRHVEEVEREVLERAAEEVLGWKRPEARRAEGS